MSSICLYVSLDFICLFIHLLYTVLELNFDDVLEHDLLYEINLHIFKSTEGKLGQLNLSRFLQKLHHKQSLKQFLEYDMLLDMYARNVMIMNTAKGWGCKGHFLSSYTLMHPNNNN